MKVECTKLEWARLETIFLNEFGFTSTSYNWPNFRCAIIDGSIDNDEILLDITGTFIEDEHEKEKNPIIKGMKLLSKFMYHDEVDALEKMFRRIYDELYAEKILKKSMEDILVELKPIIDHIKEHDSEG